MTDFSHLHTLEQRAVRIRERMSACRNNDTQWKAQAVQLFQTEKEIADEREFLGLEDMDADKLYAELLDDHESEVAMQVIESTADRPLWEKHKEQERQALMAALAERERLDPDAPKAIAFKDAGDSQLRNTQNALRNLYKAVQKSRAVNDPLGMATAMEEAGRWF